MAKNTRRQKHDTGHTLGPLTYRPSIVGNDLYAIYQGSRQIACAVRMEDARLYAAAPAMLTELQDAAAHCDACDGKGNAYTMEDETQIGQVPGSSRIDCPICTSWRVGIAKATGAAP